MCFPFFFLEFLSFLIKHWRLFWYGFNGCLGLVYTLGWENVLHIEFIERFSQLHFISRLGVVKAITVKLFVFDSMLRLGPTNYVQNIYMVPKTASVTIHLKSI